MREWWDRGVDLRRRVADWAAHIFREYNKEADVKNEWIDVIWSEVAGLCGFLGQGMVDTTSFRETQIALSRNHRTDNTWTYPEYI